MGVLCKETVHEQESVCSWPVRGNWDFLSHPCGTWVGILFRFLVVFFFFFFCLLPLDTRWQITFILHVWFPAFVHHVCTTQRRSNKSWNIKTKRFILYSYTNIWTSSAQEKVFQIGVKCYSLATNVESFPAGKTRCTWGEADARTRTTNVSHWHEETGLTFLFHPFRKYQSDYERIHTTKFWTWDKNAFNEK